MKHRNVWARVCAFIFCLLLLAPGCTGKQPQNDENTEQILAELNALREQLDKANSEIETMKNSEIEAVVTSVPETPAPAVTPEIIREEVKVEVDVEAITGIRCKINGETRVRLDGETKVHAVAEKIKGYVFDHWEVNGETSKVTGAEADFTFSEPTVLCAAYHQQHIVTCINCHMQLLNSKNNAEGDKMTKFDFEKDYKNPNTGKTCKGGTVDFYLTADTPKGMVVDYWLINGVKYQAPNNVYKFRVVGLDEATVYEVVFKKEAAKKTYTVTCKNCTFSGGSLKNAKSGKVEEGTKITVRGVSDSSAGWFDGTPSAAGRGSYSKPLSPTSGSSGKYVFTYTYTVTSDTTIAFYGIIN